MIAGVTSSMAGEYQIRLASRRANRDACDARHLRLSRVRLAIVLVTVALVLVQGSAAGWWYAVPAAAFAAAAIAHAVVLNARARADSAVEFYERGLARLSHAWMGAGDAGERYRTLDHPYADDVDLFGRGSAFDLIGTARTRAGQDVLARWLLAPAAPDTISARHDAIRELSPRLDLRERLAVQGDTSGSNIDAARLRQWATAPPVLRGLAVRLVLAALGAAVVVIIAVWVAQGTLGTGLGRLLLGLLLVQGAIAQWLRGRVAQVAGSVEMAADDLGLLAGVLRTIEQEPVSSAILTRIRRDLDGGARDASQEIARLDRLAGVLQARRNLIFAATAAAVAGATQVAFAIEAWRARVGSDVPRWLDAVGDFEALNALAGYSAEHPGYAFPEVAHSGPTFEAVQLAHPLLPDEAVPNDVALGADHPHLLILSGSNMSGKSTLLRAVGLTAVLSQAGAPVRAERLRLSPLAVGASIRIQDSLLDGRSRFLAEILRLKQIVDLTKARGGALLFLLDEVLGGTNSHDRVAGAEAVLTGLTGAGAIGIATTHDLSLGRVAERLSSLAANAHLADAFDGGGLSFDYRLRPGIVRTSNAIALMRSIGLDVPS